MDLITKHLTVLGLTQEESSIYLNALESQASTVLEFSLNTGIPRTTVYLLVDSLLLKGVLTEVVDGKKKKYIPLEPEQLISLAKKKEIEYRETAKALERDISQIQALFNKREGVPKIYIKEGKKALREVFNDSLNADIIFMHFTSTVGYSLFSDIGEQYYESYMKKLVETKQIINASSKNVEYQKRESTDRNQIVLIDSKYALNNDYLIYGNKVIFITYKSSEPYLIIIEDENIAYSEKIRYNVLFNSLLPKEEVNYTKLDQ